MKKAIALFLLFLFLAVPSFAQNLQKFYADLLKEVFEITGSFKKALETISYVQENPEYMKKLMRVGINKESVQELLQQIEKERGLLQQIEKKSSQIEKKVPKTGEAPKREENFANAENVFVKNEKFCLKHALLIRSCFDAGIQDKCEVVQTVVSEVKDEYVRKYPNIPTLGILFDITKDHCVSTCTIAKRYKNVMKSQELEEHRDAIFASAYNSCMCDCKKK